MAEERMMLKRNQGAELANQTYAPPGNLPIELGQKGTARANIDVVLHRRVLKQLDPTMKASSH